MKSVLLTVISRLLFTHTRKVRLKHPKRLDRKMRSGNIMICCTKPSVNGLV